MPIRTQSEDRTIGGDERDQARPNAVIGCTCEDRATESSAQAWQNLDLLYGGRRRVPAGMV